MTPLLVLLGLLQLGLAVPSLPDAPIVADVPVTVNVPITVDVISGQPFNGPSQVQFDVTGAGFDGPKIKNLNSTTFDLWYFDVISEDLDKFALAIFYTAQPGALFPGQPDLGTATYAQVVLFDGEQQIGAGAVVPADNMTVLTLGDGSTGALFGPSGNAMWTGSADLSAWKVAIDSPEQNMTGTLTLESIAPAHYPCGPIETPAGQSFELAPNLGWANAVPDARGTVDMTVNGERVQFSGFGYHDKNWGEKPWSETLDFWYWGHVHAEPYSIVWFDYVTPEGVEGGSTYISRNGTVISATCDTGLKVRPINSTFPPTTNSTLPDDFTLSLPVPGQGVMTLTTVNASVAVQRPGVFARWVSKVTGEFAGEELEGYAMYEQFTFAE